MNKYFKYSISERKYSSNIILGHYMIYVDGKEKEKTDIILVSCLNKKEADIFISDIFKKLYDK